MNFSKEDYIRAIYHLSEEYKGKVRSIDLAKYLNISKASVSEMLNKLSKHKLILIRPYGPIRLTKKGLTEGKKLTYKHRMIELFLSKVLGLRLSRVHNEANGIEHALSNLAVKKMSLIMKNPVYCPHGKPIKVQIL